MRPGSSCAGRVVRSEIFTLERRGGDADRATKTFPGANERGAVAGDGAPVLTDRFVSYWLTAKPIGLSLSYAHMPQRDEGSHGALGRPPRDISGTGRLFGRHEFLVLDVLLSEEDRYTRLAD